MNVRWTDSFLNGLEIELVSAILAITLISIMMIALVSLLARIWQGVRSRNIKPGIYFGLWNDPIRHETNISINRLKRSFGRFYLSILYAPNLRPVWGARMTPLLISGDCLSGELKTQDSGRVHKTPVLFQLRSEPYIGKLLGAVSGGHQKGTDVDDRKHKGRSNEYIQYKTNPIWYWLTQIKLPAKVSIIQGIIEKHESLSGDQKYYYQGLEFDIPSHSFNPTFGKVSTLLLEYVKSCVVPSSKVLDLGTGTGYYAVTLARQRGCQVTGIDIDDQEINVARINAWRNGVRENTAFYTVRKNHPFEKVGTNEKFDLIIANLPFSRTSQIWKLRHHRMAQCFHGKRWLLEMLILGSAYHIERNGRLVFAYSDSGYKNFLDDLIEVSPWTINFRECVNREKDDSFYIYDLRLNDDFLSLLDKQKS
ncbi:hypothetical protein BTA51_20530 [Hahella sp. CCB-MM4]|uniref:methyltransferase domain-containing protein n=1 Tax=Hahella sp. (strain CCB-MM4) TaxID=1926491 RepID=UPI000B9A8A58|nr:methyltransferase domain-containing protein [Hahella sp. CCB-MM4]OZG71342.1 hypothetical protein BTA51_20530 [Hahella sp. CCB-MM4]